MSRMRARTLRASSSFLNCSFGLSGSRYPSAHWPSPRGRFTDAGEPADVLRAVVIGFGSSVEPDRASSPGALRRRRSGGQLKVQVGRSTASGQTTTGTDTLEIDMPPSHQRDAVGEVGGRHGVNCATDSHTSPNRGRFALTVSKSPSGRLGI